MSRIIITDKGEISLESSSKIYIKPSPIGVLVCGGIAHKPASAEVCGGTVKVKYPHGECTLLCEDKDGYHKLTLLTAPEDADGFVFGPYETDASDYGDTLGAGWFDDGSAACIQSLMPKVEEGTYVRITENKTGLPLSLGGAASNSGGVVRLHCFAKDRSKPNTDNNCLYWDFWHMENAITGAVDGPDAKIEGAAIALIGASDRYELIDIIEKMELAEGLPHPTIFGSYAKKDPRISSFYLIFDGWTMTNEERIEAAKKAGVSCVYFCDIFDKWGHITVNREKFPGGAEEVLKSCDEAARNGIIVGAHTMTNFISTNDEYVTPIPHERLLAADSTTLARDVDAVSDRIYLTSEAHYSLPSGLSTLKIENELVIFRGFDKDELCLLDCERGAYGTTPSEHKAGAEARRLIDIYNSFYPDIELQDEVADSVGNNIRACGLHKMSFDGLEGTAFTGHENYARARFVKRVFDIVGSELICDGSNYSHYLWHAFSYGNWGEPFYDDNHRGGMYTRRTKTLKYFKNNLIPNMLGWYLIVKSDGRWEATQPETLEFILSRSAAFDAGGALQISTWTYHDHGLMSDYLDLIKLWSDFRIRADIPDYVRERMQEETFNWHLEKDGDGWKLYEQVVRKWDLAYCDGIIKTEACAFGEEISQSDDGMRVYHSSTVIWDDVSPELGEEEPVYFRIRVGEPGCGYMESLNLYGLIDFKFTAVGGDYLVYKGGNELYHYDKDFNLKALVKGEGTPMTIGRNQRYLWGKFNYTTDNDPHARYILTEIRNRRVYRILPKQDRA